METMVRVHSITSDQINAYVVHTPAYVAFDWL